jgi:hypothetical protein
MKVIGKIHSGIFLVGRIVNFHFHTNLGFSDSRFWSYWRFSGKHQFLEKSGFSQKVGKKTGK